MFFTFIGYVACARYAFLYTGSNKFYNYRHQADIYTIYNKLLNRGFTSQNIALYAYDDIATIRENPFTGQVFHSIDHKINVYPGSSAINVKGDEVTAQAFHNMITNLPTTKEDYVFIYYDDHGGLGILGTPSGKSIYGDELNISFYKAETSKLYKKCLFIIEACNSGSVGKLLDAPNLATITTANEDESSYAAVYDPQLGTYISDECTNYFIDLIDDQPSITVSELYEILKTKTVQSHVMFYGDDNIKELPLSTFIGMPEELPPRGDRLEKISFATQQEAEEITLQRLFTHEKASIRAKSRLELLRRHTRSEHLTSVLEMIADEVGGAKCGEPPEIGDSYFAILKYFEARFGQVDACDYWKLKVLADLSACHTEAEIIRAMYMII